MIIILLIFGIVGWTWAICLYFNRIKFEKNIKNKYKDILKRKNNLITDQREKILYFKYCLIKKIKK